MARQVQYHYRGGAYVDHNAGRLCRWCREPLPAFPFGGMGPPRKFCDAKCRRAWSSGAYKRFLKAKARGSSGGRMIDHIAVFEHAKWKCQSCGCDTPRELMGKNQWNSPELDHIEPCWRGGAHLISNVQLLCRRCNVDKAMREYADWEAACESPPGSKSLGPVAPRPAAPLRAQNREMKAGGRTHD